VKKVKTCVVICFVLLFTLGCASDQFREKKVYVEGYELLKCDMTVEEETEAQVMYLQIVRDIKASKIVDTSINLEFDYSDMLKDDSKGTAKKTVHSGLNLMCDAFEKEGYVDCYYTVDNNIYTVSMGVNINDLGESVVTENASLEDIKTAIETQNELKVKNCVLEK
jgi:hypothetical protein